MLKIILSSILVMGLITAKSQGQLTYNYCLTPFASTATDSVSLQASLNASDGYKSITWSQISGPAASVINTVNSYSNTMVQVSVATIHKMVPGTYVFQALGVTQTGISLPLKSTVTVLAAAAPRKVVSMALQLVNGVLVPAFKFDDGSTQ